MQCRSQAPEQQPDPECRLLRHGLQREWRQPSSFQAHCFWYVLLIPFSLPNFKLTKSLAGSSVTIEWHHDTRTSQAIDPSHKGPVITYLAKVPNAAAANSPASLNWFKMYVILPKSNPWAHLGILWVLTNLDE